MFGQIINKKDGTIIARAPVEDIVHLEGNYYFNSEVAEPEYMEISDRTYNCPRKGICNWIDMKTDTGYLNDIAWVYPETRPGFENIAGRIGFYGNHKYYEYIESN